MSLIRRIWQSWRKPTGYVGADLQGNRFFEHPSSTEDPRRTKRTVKYNHPDDMWHYIGGSRRLPVQWTAWLTHTRAEPPTLEELEADITRQRRVLYNAALIEARERDERAKALLPPPAELAPEGSRENSATTSLSLIEVERPNGADKLQVSSTSRPTPSAPASELPKMATEPEYEPQSWVPRARSRSKG